MSAFPPKNAHLGYLPKFLMTFLVIDFFNVFTWYFSVGGPIRSRQRYGGPKSLLLGKFTMLSLLFLPPRGAQTPLPTSMGGWPDSPLDQPLIRIVANLPLRINKK